MPTSISNDYIVKVQYSLPCPPVRQGQQEKKADSLTYLLTLPYLKFRYPGLRFAEKNDVHVFKVCPKVALERVDLRPVLELVFTRVLAFLNTTVD